MVNISHPIWYIKVRKATISSVKKYVDINTEKSNDVDILQIKPIDTAPAVQIIPVLSDISIGVMFSTIQIQLHYKKLQMC